MVANGDIDHPHKAARVLDATGADAVMIGRAAQGRPWLFRQIWEYFQSGTIFVPDLEQQRDTMLRHLVNLYDFYGTHAGVRIARKHISWYARARTSGRSFWDRIKNVDCAEQQYDMMSRYFHSGFCAT